jgi:hypothetical protein
MAWKRKPVTLPADLEELKRMTDDELMAEAGSMILYEVSSGFVAVSTTNPNMSKKEMLAALHDIAEAIEEYGIPDGPMDLKKRIM